uniref:F-box domain-containing protein n=1 Tax=Timema cristinae TaxID=61476 RepID=A0A7R9CTP8_TIMCR|nr:unnamed protein product [Timema cristinae]
MYRYKTLSHSPDRDRKKRLMEGNEGFRMNKSFQRDATHPSFPILRLDAVELPLRRHFLLSAAAAQQSNDNSHRSRSRGRIRMLSCLEGKVSSSGSCFSPREGVVHPHPTYGSPHFQLQMVKKQIQKQVHPDNCILMRVEKVAGGGGALPNFPSWEVGLSVVGNSAHLVREVGRLSDSLADIHSDHVAHRLGAVVVRGTSASGRSVAARRSVWVRTYHEYNSIVALDGESKAEDVFAGLANKYLRNKPLFRGSSSLSGLWTWSVVTRGNNLGNYDPMPAIGPYHRRTTRHWLDLPTPTHPATFGMFTHHLREKYNSAMTSSEETVGKDIETEFRRVVVNHLPNEMLLKIFSLLDIEDICYSTRYVCKRWNVISNDETLWKNFEFVCTKNMTLGYIYKMLRSARLLRAVVLQWRLDTAGILEVLCKCCPDIQRIQLICCGMINLNTMEMLAVRYPKLLHLSMGKSFSVQRDCFDILGQFRKIQSINLSHSKLTGDQLKLIIDSCPDLIEINIDYVRGIEDTYILNIIAAKKETLVSLAIFGDCLTDITFESFQEFGAIAICIGSDLHVARISEEDTRASMTGRLLVLLIYYYYYY